MFVDGVVDGRHHALLLDTGATKTIMRPDLLDRRRTLKTTNWRLRTVTGDAATIHGEAQVTLKIGGASFPHDVLIADIEDEFILGMDVMTKHGFELNLRRGTLRVEGEELVLQHREEVRIQVVLAEDVTVSKRSECLVSASLGNTTHEGYPVLLEPKNDDNEVGRGVLIAKEVVSAAERIPVRVMNVNSYSVTLRKGTVLGE